MKTVLCLLASLVALPSAADTLVDLKGALRRLPVNEPVHATITIEQSVASSGRFANDAATRVATAEVTHEAAGVSIVIPEALVTRSAREALLPARPANSAEDAIGSIRPPAVIEALNMRDSLLVMLEGATLVQETRSPFHARPARLLLLKLAPRRQKSADSVEVGSVKSDDQLRLWIGDDLIPLGAERVQTTTAGFMFLHGTFTARSSYTFAHLRDRLVLTRLETTEGGSGMGQKVEKKSVQTLIVH